MIIIKRLFHILKSDILAKISLVILFFWVCLAILPHVFPNLHVIDIRLEDRLFFPSKEYWLGTDSSGKSVALLILNGAQMSLSVSLVTVLLSLFIGVPLGALSGYYKGFFDKVVSQIIDILLAFPPLILPITIMVFLGSGFLNVILALSITGWMSYARVVRGEFLSYRRREFVIAAKALGANDIRIMFKHILPNIVSPLIVQATFALATVIIAEAGLSFLGLGVGSEYVSWGGLLNTAQDYLTSHPYLIFFPSLALFLVVLALNFFGEAVRKAFNPKSVKN
jgi:peptide/nickel transport system permease protein